MSSSIFSFESVASVLVSIARHRRFVVGASMLMLAVFGGSAYLLSVLKRLVHVPSFREIAVNRIGEGSVEIVIVGSSHIYAGVDPDIIGDECVNIADSGLDYCTAEILVRSHEERLSGLSMLVIELESVPIYQDAIGLRGGDLRDFWEWEVPPESLMECGRAVDLRNSLFARLPMTRSGALLSQLGWIDGDVYPVGPGYKPHRSVLEPNRVEEFFSGVESAGFDEAIVAENLEALRRLIQFGLSRGAIVVFVRPPMHGEYWRRLSPIRQELADRAMDVAEDELKMVPHVIDHRRLLTDDASFSDWTHVSLEGSRLWSLVLREELRHLLH